MGSSVLFLSYVLLAGTPVAPSPKATLADVAFMAGHWRGESDGGLSEEVWTAPEGDGMLGMWRWVSGGTGRVFELLSIRQEAGGPVLRLRHFDGALVAREEKGAPLVVPLVRAAAGEAVFEGRSAGGGLLRLTYRRDGENGLVATLEKDGEKPVPFRMERAGAAKR